MCVIVVGEQSVTDDRLHACGTECVPQPLVVIAFVTGETLNLVDISQRYPTVLWVSWGQYTEQWTSRTAHDSVSTKAVAFRVRLWRSNREM